MLMHIQVRGREPSAAMIHKNLREKKELKTHKFTVVQLELLIIRRENMKFETCRTWHPVGINSEG